MFELVIPNLIKDDLQILFIGINPGKRSAAVGHHFAGYSNRFWRLLYDSGLTSQHLIAEQDTVLLDFNFGITNIVPRSTVTAAEVSRSEFEEGAKALFDLLQKYHPRIAAFLGKDGYKFYAKEKNTQWGIQKPPVIETMIDYVLPNPSGLNRMPYLEQLKWYIDLKLLSSLNQCILDPDF